jgi:hypothetical protein
MATNVQLYGNNAETILSAPIGSGDLTITVVDGSKFPSPSVGQYFLVTIEVGSVNEIVKITSRSGNTFTVPIGGRGQEGTAPASWPAGALMEMRVTKGTLAAFSRYIDVMAEINSVNDLTSPINSSGNSYICHSTDDSGNPIVAVRNNDSTWKFLSHKKVLIGSGIATTGTNTTTQITSTDIGSLLTSITAGKYVLQFTSGVLAGQTRLVTSSTTNTASWSGAITQAPTPAITTFEIYQSDASLLFSGVLSLSGGTMTGPIVLAGDGTAALNPVTKQQLDAQVTALNTGINAKLPLGGGVMTGMITLASDAVSNLHPVTKQQFDASNTGLSTSISAKLPLAGGTMTGNITLVGDAVNALHPVSKQQYDANNTTLNNSIAAKLPLTGGTMSGYIVLHADAISNLNPVTKQQFDSAVTTLTNSTNAKLPLAGGTMTGNIILAGDGSSALHPVSKQQLDVVGTSAATAGALARRDGSGDASFRYVLGTSTNAENPTLSQYVVTDGSTNNFRKASAAHVNANIAPVWTNITSKPSNFVFNDGTSYNIIAASVTSQANSATINASSTNTANDIVRRNGSGGFAAGQITGTSFVGPLTGNVTGTADNATKWANAAKTVSTSAPSGGLDGDIWFKY